MAEPTIPTIPTTSDLDKTAESLLTKATAILQAIEQAGIGLYDPETLLALQLLGPVLSLAVGDNPRRNTDNLITIAETLDLEIVRSMLRGDLT